MKSYLLLPAVIFMGLSAGFFLAWQISVLPGTLRVGDQIYLNVMQSINRAILNPAFFSVFFGSFILLSAAGIYEFNQNKTVFMLILIAAVLYLFGTIGVTGLGNVPLNDALDALDLGNIPEKAAREFRAMYETKWNRLHLIRTAAAVISYILSTWALLIKN